MEKVYDTTEAAQFLGISPGTLRNWNSEKRGPRRSKMGRKLVYRERDLQQFRDQRVILK